MGRKHNSTGHVHLFVVSSISTVFINYKIKLNSHAK